MSRVVCYFEKQIRFALACSRTVTLARGREKEKVLRKSRDSWTNSIWTDLLPKSVSDVGGQDRACAPRTFPSREQHVAPDAQGQATQQGARSTHKGNDMALVHDRLTYPTSLIEIGHKSKKCSGASTQAHQSDQLKKNGQVLCRRVSTPASDLQPRLRRRGHLQLAKRRMLMGWLALHHWW